MVTDREITLMTGLSIQEQRDLMAENKRLRAALQLVADLDTSGDGWPMGLAWAISSARVLLGELND